MFANDASVGSKAVSVARDWRQQVLSADRGRLEGLFRRAQGKAGGRGRQAPPPPPKMQELRNNAFAGLANLKLKK